MDALALWDLLLLGVGIYVATLTLVRLMAAYREQLVADIRRQIQQEQRRQQERRPRRPDGSPATGRAVVMGKPENQV